MPRPQHETPVRRCFPTQRYVRLNDGEVVAGVAFEELDTILVYVEALEQMARQQNVDPDAMWAAASRYVTFPADVDVVDLIVKQYGGV